MTPIVAIVHWKCQTHRILTLLTTASRTAEKAVLASEFSKVSLESSRSFRTLWRGRPKQTEIASYAVGHRRVNERATYDITFHLGWRWTQSQSWENSTMCGLPRVDQPPWLIQESILRPATVRQCTSRLRQWALVRHPTGKSIEPETKVKASQTNQFAFFDSKSQR